LFCYPQSNSEEDEEKEQEEKEEIQAAVAKKQRKVAEKYLAKAQAKALSKKRQRRRFHVGDQVLVCYNVQKSKKKGKVRFPYTAEVVDVSVDEQYFKIKWLSRYPASEKEGEICKKKFRWDQLLLNENDEQQGWVIQQFLMADSYNTSQQQIRCEYLDKIWRQRKTERGELELLCTWKDKKKPTWERVATVGDTEQFTLFQRNAEYFEDIRGQSREEEEKEQRFSVEKIFFQRGSKVLILWQNFDEPTFEEIKKVRHLKVYKKWREEVENPYDSNEDRPEEID
jgi:hypothetical protein